MRHGLAEEANVRHFQSNQRPGVWNYLFPLDNVNTELGNYHVYFTLLCTIIRYLDTEQFGRILSTRVRVTLQLTVSLGVELNLGLLTRDIFLSFFF
jgi:hypothetical protein